jgi:8-oxo-dGTP diphosphatase
MTRKKSGFTYEYPRPALTVDIVLVSRSAEPEVLLIRRKHEPFAGCWAIPGALSMKASRWSRPPGRELREETGVEVDKLEQVGTFGDPGRDPRGWTVAVAHLARVSPSKVAAKAADDAAELAWHSLAKLPPLAFDHAKILDAVRRRLPKRKKRAVKR